MSDTLKRDLMLLVEDVLVKSNFITSWNNRITNTSDLIDGLVRDEDAFKVTLSDGTGFTLSLSEIHVPNVHSFTANLNGCLLLTVKAKNNEDALDKLTDELTKNPSRRSIYEKWVLQGCPFERID